MTTPVLRLCRLRSYGLPATLEPDRTVAESGYVEHDLMSDDPFLTLHRIGQMMGMKRMSEEQDRRYAEIIAARAARAASTKEK